MGELRAVLGAVQYGMQFLDNKVQVKLKFHSDFFF